MRNFLASLVCFAALLSTLAFAETTTLHIVGDDQAHPKNWLENGQPKGIMIDILSEVTRRTSIEFTYDLAPWNRSFQLSSRGLGAIIGFSKTEKREKSWDYSVPMYFDELVIVTLKKNAFEFKGLDSLKGKRVAIKKGTSYGDDFEEARANGLFKTIETVDRSGQMRMMTLDRVDAILLSPGKLGLASVIQNNSWLTEHKDNFVILSPPYKRDPNYLGIPKSMNMSHLLEPINKAITEMIIDGTHQQIIDENIELFLKSLN